MANQPAHLRVVGDGESVKPITSVEDAVMRGTTLDVFEQSLLVAARALDDDSTTAVAKAALLNQLTKLKNEVDSLKHAAAEEADEHVSAAGPEAWDSAAV